MCQCENFFIEENFFKSTKLSSIQRNFFFDRILKKYFFHSKKLLPQCRLYQTLLQALLKFHINFRIFSIFTAKNF